MPGIQQSAANKLLLEQCSRFLKTLPAVDFAMIYGSGAFPQEGAQASQRKQIDFILSISDSKQWHEQNLSQNPEHYSFMKYFGPSAISRVQDVGPGLYYHPYIDFEDRVWKYGVISTKTLLSDLKNWDTLYSSARLMNPHRVLCDTPEIQIACKINQEAAVRLALILTENKDFAEDELYRNICSIGFQGDVKWVAENPKKINNIINKNFWWYEKMYRSLLEEYTIPVDMAKYRQQARLSNDKILLLLPSLFLDRMKKHVHEEKTMQKSIRLTLHDIIRKNSTSQSLKGFFSAGPVKSYMYIQDKLSKR